MVAFRFLWVLDIPKRLFKERVSMTKTRIKCGNCPKRFAPKRSNQRHCSPACRNASYEKSVKGVARQKLYNATDKRKKVQAAYARSEKGAVRRDRWQYSKAGRAWRDIWTGKTARIKEEREKQKAWKRERRESDAAFKKKCKSDKAEAAKRKAAFDKKLERELAMLKENLYAA